MAARAQGEGNWSVHLCASVGAGGDALLVRGAGDGVLDAVALAPEDGVVGSGEGAAPAAWEARLDAAIGEGALEPVRPRPRPRTGGGRWLGSPGRPGGPWREAVTTARRPWRGRGPARRRGRWSGRPTGPSGWAGLGPRRRPGAWSRGRPWRARSAGRTGPRGPRLARQAGRGAGRLHGGRIDHQGLRVLARGRELQGDAGEQAHPAPAPPAIVRGVLGRPWAAGASCHISPSRWTWMIPLSTCRSSTRARPRLGNETPQPLHRRLGQPSPTRPAPPPWRPIEPDLAHPNEPAREP